MRTALIFLAITTAACDFRAELLERRAEEAPFTTYPEVDPVRLDELDADPVWTAEPAVDEEPSSQGSLPAATPIVTSPSNCATLTETRQATLSIAFTSTLGVASLQLDVATTSGCDRPPLASIASMTLSSSTRTVVITDLEEDTWYRYRLTSNPRPGFGPSSTIGFFKTGECSCSEAAFTRWRCQPDGSCTCTPKTCEGDRLCGTILQRDFCDPAATLPCPLCPANPYDWAPAPMTGIVDPTNWIIGPLTVEDTSTGLMWTVDRFTITYSENAFFCEALDYAGYTDWTAPTIVQILTIYDYSIHDSYPPFEGSDWEGTAGGSREPEDGDFRALRPTYGNVGQASGIVGGDGNELPVSATRCVRRLPYAPIPTEPPARYVLTTNTVEDVDTNLIWQRQHGSASTHADAVDACNAATTAGYDDWRLPEAYELATLTKYSRPNVLIDEVAFPTAAAGHYVWSNTPTVFCCPMNFYYLVIDTGGADTFVSGQGNAFRCVRP
jgi:hypothetical protein